MRQAVSVIIPTYNRAAIISRALETVLWQICPQDEIIVVDDGSVDETAEVVRSFERKVKRAGSTIRYIYQENAGAGAARNRGIREVRHDLIAFLDSDDEWLPGKLEMQRALMAARSDLVACFGDFKLRFADGRLVDRGMVRWHRDPRTWEERLGESQLLSRLTGWPEENDVRVFTGDLYAVHLTACYISAFTVMVRHSVAGEALYFTEGIGMYEDWACFARLTRVGPTAFLDRDLAIQNGHLDGRLTDADAYVRAVSRVTVMEEIWGSDPEFLQTHGERYREILDEQRVIKAAGLISEGKMAEARAELALVHDAPLPHRVVAMLPAAVVRVLLALRRAVRRKW